MVTSRCSCPTARSGTLAKAAAPRRPLRFKNWNVCSAALKSGDIGFAESYIAGDWTTPHLTDLLKLFIANRQQVEGVIYGTWAGPAAVPHQAPAQPQHQAPTARRTSTRITTWAMRFMSCGWTTR